jgi:hypothetical protein
MLCMDDDRIHLGPSQNKMLDGQALGGPTTRQCVAEVIRLFEVGAKCMCQLISH